MTVDSMNFLETLDYIPPDPKEETTPKDNSDTTPENTGSENNNEESEE